LTKYQRVCGAGILRKDQTIQSIYVKELSNSTYSIHAEVFSDQATVVINGDIQVEIPPHTLKRAWWHVGCYEGGSFALTNYVSEAKLDLC
jgi:hypothetical protein